MKTITILFTALFLNFAIPGLQAQEGTPQERERMEEQKETIIAEEKAALKKSVEIINLRLENQEITRNEANSLKEEAARRHALNIENRIAILENELEWATRNEIEVKERSNDLKKDGHLSSEEKSRREIKYSDRTSTHLLIAGGFNNAMQQGQDINDLDFQLAGSRFFEIGLTWRTRVFENSNFLRLRYGFSFQFNGLKPTDNRYFVEEGDLTFLDTYPLDLNKSKFRMDNLVFPVHFEFGPSKRIDTKNRTWFSTANRLRLGVGGYAGFNIGERQKLKYHDDGDRVRRKNTGDFNTTDFIYGLSGYLGLGGTALYVKYDLNPIFETPNTELHNVSIGLRFDID